MTISRGGFCRLTGGAFLAPFLLAPRAADAANAPILVTVFLYGGCDLLNAVIPISTKQYGAYRTLRTPNIAPADPTLNLVIDGAAIAAAGTAFDANPATPASRATQYAFHPAMTALRSIYGGGHLAVVAGVGIPPKDPLRLGHDSAQFDWHTGTIVATGRAPVGWAGRIFDGTAAVAGLPPTAALDGSTPIVLRGRTNVPLSVASPLERFTLNYGTSDSAEQARRDNALASVEAVAALESGGELVRGVATDARGLVANIGALASANAASDYPVTASANAFINLQLKQVARMIVGGAGTRAYFASQGGYDTHRAQNHVQPVLLGQLSDALASFYTYLRAKGKSSNVIVMTLTDFGRRLNINSTYGTDHGTASASFVMGDPVTGGVYGTYPDLTAPDANGNAVISLDFRNEIADVIGYVGGDATSILGTSYPKIGFI